MTFWHTKSLEDHGLLKDLHGAEASAAKTLASVTGYDGRYSTSEQRLAETAGVAKNTLRGAVQKLETLGVISRYRAGRRSATVYTWHSCPVDCVDVNHTGKKDTRASRFLFGAVVETVDNLEATPKKKPGKTARRRNAAERVKLSLSEDVKTATKPAPLNHSSSSVSSSVNPPLNHSSSSVTAPLKDKPGLKREEVEQSVSSSVSSSVDYLTAYAVVYEALEKLADSDELDSLEAEVLLALLDTPEQSGVVTALAVELFTPDRFASLTFSDAEALRELFEQKTKLDTRELFKAIYTYNRQPGKNWRTLPMVTRAEWVKRYTYAAELARVSVVANSVSATVPNSLPSSFPPAEQQKQKLFTALEQLDQAAAGVASPEGVASVTAPVVALDDYRQQRTQGVG